jgi:transcriptional regulator NrdR family protein
MSGDKPPSSLTTNPKLCPECGQRGDCFNSRWEASFVRRRYQCDNGHRWSTAEIVVPNGAPTHVTQWLKDTRADLWKKRIATRLRELLAEVEA